MSPDGEFDAQGFSGLFRSSNHSIKSDNKANKITNKKDKKEKSGYQHFAKSSSDEELIKNKEANNEKKNKSSMFKFSNPKDKTPKSKDKDNLSTPKKDTIDFAGRQSSLPQNFFRLPLHETLKYDCHEDGVPLPMLVRTCIDYIEENVNVASKDGIYKKHATKGLIEKLKSQYVENGFLDWSDFDEHKSLAPTLMRHYVKHLPDPIVPLNIELTLMEQVTTFREKHQQNSSTVADDSNAKSHKHKDKVIEATTTPSPLKLIQSILNERLPISHWYLLAYLLSHFLNLIKLENENKFSLANCIHIFAPLLRLHPKLLKVLLIHFKELFPGLIVKRISKTMCGYEKDYAENLDMPNCLSDLEKELADQERVLKELHQKMMQFEATKVAERDTNPPLAFKKDTTIQADKVVKKIKHTQSFTKGSHSFYSRYGKKANPVPPTPQVDGSEIKLAKIGDKELVGKVTKNDVDTKCGETYKRLEEDLWKVQRHITQLKRKVRLCKQAEYPKKPEELLEPGKILEPRKMGPFQALAGKFLEPMKATTPASKAANRDRNDVSIIIPLTANDLRFCATFSPGPQTNEVPSKGSQNGSATRTALPGEDVKPYLQTVDRVGPSLSLPFDSGLLETVVCDEVCPNSTSSDETSSLAITEYDRDYSNYSTTSRDTYTGNSPINKADRNQQSWANPAFAEPTFPNASSEMDSDLEEDDLFCADPLKDASTLNEILSRLIQLLVPSLPNYRHPGDTAQVIPLTVPIVTLLGCLIQEKFLLEESEKLKLEIEGEGKAVKHLSKCLRSKHGQPLKENSNSDQNPQDFQSYLHCADEDPNADLYCEELIPLFNESKYRASAESIESPIDLPSLDNRNKVLEKTNSDIIDNLYYQRNEIISLKVKILLIQLLKKVNEDRRSLVGFWRGIPFEFINYLAPTSPANRTIKTCPVVTRRDILAINFDHTLQLPPINHIY